MISQTTYDRLSYEPPERIVCVRSILSDTEYQKLRFYIPKTQSEYDDITRLGDKVKSCWNIAVTSTSQVATSVSAASSTPIEADKCLLTNLGETVYKEIFAGNRTPTYQEHLIFEKCNGNLVADPVNYLTSQQDLPPAINNCLQTVLTEQNYNLIKSGKNDVPPELRQKVDQCFGADPQPFQEAKVYKIPDEIKSCLQAAVGNERFELLSSAKIEPTDSEKTKANACFEKLNKAQKNFLPPPAEKLGFADIDTKSVNLANVSQFKNEDKKVIGGSLKFSGKGIPNTNVYIYIFSEPLVVTTSTDENGDWVYELKEPLKGEKHIAYAAVKNSSGKLVRSGVFDFTVVAAESDLQNTFIKEEVGIQSATNIFLIYGLILMSAGLLMATLIYILYFQKQFAKSNVTVLDDGESESKTATGTIN
jgi:hypothetical protein